MFAIEKTFDFHAAHRLPHHDGACANLHGHTYRVIVRVEHDKLQEGGAARGMVLDFTDIKTAWEVKCFPKLDHADLNEVLENPTAEELALWIFRQLTGLVSGLAEIRVYETPTACAIFRA